MEDILAVGSLLSHNCGFRCIGDQTNQRAKAPLSARMAPVFASSQGTQASALAMAAANGVAEEQFLAFSAVGKTSGKALVGTAVSEADPLHWGSANVGADDGPGKVSDGWRKDTAFWAILLMDAVGSS
jgi:hypothetical protein